MPDHQYQQTEFMRFVEREAGLSPRAKPDSTRLILLFLSLDLQDGTKLKNVNPLWPQVFDRFRSSARQIVTQEQPGAKFVSDKIPYGIQQGWNFWKQIGDEVLFFLPIAVLSKEGGDAEGRGDVEFVEEALIHFRGKSEVATKHLHSCDMLEIIWGQLEFISGELENLSKAIHNCNSHGTQNIISLKTTVWISEVMEMSAAINSDVDGGFARGKEVRNFFFQSKHNNKQIDFLGPEIDMGFRIAKYAHRQKVAVCTATAYCMLRYLNEVKPSLSGNLKKFRIISYEKLKGVWSGREYPIIWFHHNMESGNVEKDTFYYFEKFNNVEVPRVIEIIKNYDPSTNSIELIRHILGDLPYRKIWSGD